MALTKVIGNGLGATQEGAITFNEGSANVDFRVESDGDPNMLFVDGGGNRIYIGRDATDGLFNSKLQIESSGSDTGLSMHRNGGNPYLSMSASGGSSLGDDTAVADDAGLGTIYWSGADGTDRATGAAYIAAFVDATPGANDMPGRLVFATTADGSSSPTERARIDNAGNLLVGTSNANPAENNVVGIGLLAGNSISITDNGGAPVQLNRKSSDGALAIFRRDGTAFGTIGSASSRLHIASTGNSGIRFRNDLNCFTPCNDDGSNSDNDQNIGQASVRYTQIFATNASINTSDRTEKQDIEELTDAEKRVAVVAKGLMRKYRWKDAVASKGDKARIHFGIIAQDLQDAFTAESLDASRYSMFCSDTWWEKEISVDAVEADEEKGIKAKDAYTYMDDKQEATTGYTEKTRLGVRYSELLAFIISAI